MDIKKINEEIELSMNEMATIYKGKLSLIVTPDANRNLFNDEYFKVFKGTNYRKATEICRIKFREPIYIEHRNKDGKANFKLSSTEKKLLIKTIELPSNIYDNMTIWQDLIMMFNSEAYGFSIKESSKLTMEVINSLPENDPRKKYLPIDLPTPNYKEL